MSALKWILVVCALSSTNGTPQRCLLYMGKCVPHCPRGLHPYHTRCDRDTISQRTCDTPEIVNLGFTCGWSRCDCNNNLILFDDGSCGTFEECYPRVYMKRRRRVRPRTGEANEGPKYSRRISQSELKDVADKNADYD